ncbi:MAG: hypothetical protein QOG65_3407 [Actinomycetota bacterium]|nr:hypothetical protein [Actinomycetota bacterium]
MSEPGLRGAGQGQTDADEIVNDLAAKGAPDLLHPVRSTNASETIGELGSISP